jgi:sulfofructose kinase
LQGEFLREGVSTHHILVQPGGRTPCCIVLVEAGTGRRSFMCYRGTLPEYRLTDEARADLRRARLLHLDGHSVCAVEEAAALIHAAGGRVMLDANRLRPQIERFLACTDILIAATRFPAAFTGVDDLAQASRRLLAAGPTTVVTTLGPDGCFCLTRDEAFHEPGFRVPVTDTTGAGDAFHGAFGYGLLHGWELRRTARFANAVASLNCRALGGRRGLPALSEVEALLENSAG